MSRAGSMAPARQLPVPLKATRVPPGPVVVSTFVSADPGDGGATAAAEGLAATVGVRRRRRHARLAPVLGGRRRRTRR